ncbi:GntR family transcriptional regulator [Leifsonia sp. Root227]|nr:GntR family transcriptional regulator [Leifsonia sp. Root227]
MDPSATTPPFEQLKSHILSAVASGDAAVGTRLPPVRALADALGLAPNTIARAYRELEHVGVLETRGRAGTFVAASDAVQREAAAAAAAFADRAADLGLTVDAALTLARAALESRLRA